MNPGINAVVGDFGSGKTLFLTYLANMNVGHRKIFANYTLYDIEYTPMAIEDVATFPPEVNNAIVLWDEGHIGAGAYDVFKKDVQKIAVFISQVRKRNLVIFWSSQIFTKPAKPLRDHTRYMYECHSVGVPGLSRIRVFDIYAEEQMINEFIFDGRELFNKYDTNEIKLPKVKEIKK